MSRFVLELPTGLLGKVSSTVIIVLVLVEGTGVTGLRVGRRITIARERRAAVGKEIFTVGSVLGVVDV